MIEIIIVDGRSTDRTLEKIKDITEDNVGVKFKILENNYRLQGYGLNIGIENISPDTQIIIRADAHSIYPENYISECIKTILEKEADNVGGVMCPVGKSFVQKAIALCMRHPLGVGDSKFHRGNYSGYVDTVYLGCFKKKVFEKVGKFDPLMTPNEDAELNLRITKSGGKIYLNKAIKVLYYPRENIKRLAVQYFSYGRGRCRTFLKHKTFTSLRQIIPIVWLFLSIFSLIGGVFISYTFLFPIILYFFVLIFATLIELVRKCKLFILLFPICLMVMHYSWALGFIVEYVISFFSKK